LKKDPVFVKSVYHSCDKPTCPKCFGFGWADNISLFDYREEFGFLECVVICQLVGCLFRTHCSAELGLILEEELGMNDKVGFRACLKEVGSV
jgi:hypothetical protein